MVKRLETVFDNKIWSRIVSILFPVLLILFSFMHINEGVTVTDTGYNYGNFVAFDGLDDMWKFSTYLSVAIGAFFTHLPFGQTMLGLNFYTGLFKIIAALVAYFFCIKVLKMRKEVVFIGEIIALGLCWCPTALIYNYLTYLLFGMGAMLLYAAIVKEKNLFFVLAGIALGLNVFVRLPNVAEVTLIVVVWLAGILYGKKIGKVIRETLFCMLGYVLGLITVFGYILCKYGLNRYVDGIKALFAMTEEADSYTVKAMIMDTVRVYIQYARWLVYGIVLVGVGILLFQIMKNRFIAVKGFICAALTIGVIYLYLKQGMFNFNYREYQSMFGWGVLLLTFCLLLGTFRILFSKREKEEKVLAAIVCVIIMITPLGSNNHLYSPINNLFLVAPFYINYIWHLLSDEKSSIMIGKVSFYLCPYKIVLVLFTGALLMQSVLFGASFVFRDGTDGKERGTVVENNPVLAGMRTNKENGENLQELDDFLRENRLIGSEAILFGNVPALAFYFELEPALSSTWPDLSSYSSGKFMEEIDRLKQEGKTPIILISSNPADTGNEENARESLKQKRQYLEEYIEGNQYLQAFSNEAFTVYIGR